MLYTIKDYYVANNEIISDKDIEEAIDIANSTGEIIKVHWSIPGNKWYPGEINAYSILIKPGSIIDEIKSKLPTIYGI